MTVRDQGCGPNEGGALIRHREGKEKSRLSGETRMKIEELFGSLFLVGRADT